MAQKGVVKAADLTDARSDLKAGKISLARFEAIILQKAGDEAYKVAKAGGMNDPLMLDRVFAGGIHKDRDGNYIFAVGLKPEN